MMQRPHHLLRNMGDDETLVLYNSYYDVDYEGRGRITQIGRSVYVLDMYYYREYLLKVAKNITNRYLMVYSTDTVPQRRIDGYLSCGFKVIYEYVDDINPDLIAPNKINEILKRHSILLKNRRVSHCRRQRINCIKMCWNVRESKCDSDIQWCGMRKV